MRRFIMMLLVAITFVACEKDSPANEVPVEPENPNEMPVERMEWEIPAKLPENIVDIIVNAPCWKYYHIACSGEVINGKAVIENVAWQRLDGNEAKNTFKFHKTMVYDKYWYYDIPNYPKTTQHISSKWSTTQILENNGNRVIFATGDLTKEGANLQIFFLEIGSQEVLNEMIANLPDDSNNE